MSDPKKSAETLPAKPAWLVRIQENSWEPEILISGIALAFIFAFPAQIYEFSTYLIQEKGVNFVGGLLVFIYLSFVVNVYKIFFILHLCLRFAWVGTVGLSYAFPKGVIKEKLFKVGQNEEYKHPTELVLQLERICSMAFGIPLMLSLIFLPITGYLMMLGTIYMWFNLPFFAVYGLFLFSLLIPVFILLNKKKNVHKSRHASSLVGSISATYASNIGKWKMNAYMIGIFVISIPFIISDSKGIMLYANASSMKVDSTEWQQDALFDSAENQKNRFPKIRFESSRIDKEVAALYIAHYEEDAALVEKLNSYHLPALDSLDFVLNKPIDCFKVYVNDSLIQPLGWEGVRIGPTMQRAYKTFIPLKELSQGFHSLRIEKITLVDFGFGAGKLRHRKHWAHLRFFKE